MPSRLTTRTPGAASSASCSSSMPAASCTCQRSSASPTRARSSGREPGTEQVPDAQVPVARGQRPACVAPTSAYVSPVGSGTGPQEPQAEQRAQDEAERVGHAVRRGHPRQARVRQAGRLADRPPEREQHRDDDRRRTDPQEHPGRAGTDEPHGRRRGAPEPEGQHRRTRPARRRPRRSSRPAPGARRRGPPSRDPRQPAVRRVRHQADHQARAEPGEQHVRHGQGEVVAGEPEQPPARPLRDERQRPRPAASPARPRWTAAGRAARSRPGRPRPAAKGTASSGRRGPHRQPDAHRREQADQRPQHRRRAAAPPGRPAGAARAGSTTTVPRPDHHADDVGRDRRQLAHARTARTRARTSSAAPRSTGSRDSRTSRPISGAIPSTSVRVRRWPGEPS